MLTIQWFDVGPATMNIVVVLAAIMFPLDRPNDLAVRPIPQAW